MEKRMVTVYTFDEIIDSPTVQDTAKRRARQFMTSLYDNHEWHDYIIDHWTNIELPKRGYENAQIFFSLGFSQGDYAVFDADIYGYQLLHNNSLSYYYPSLSRYLKRQESESHIGRVVRESNTSYVRMHDSSEIGKVSSVCMQDIVILGKFIEGDVKKINSEIYVELRDEYMFITSDEELSRSAKVNKYVFFRDGRPAHHLTKELETT